MTAIAASAHTDIDHQKVGGVAALYLALALLGAIPYFLVVVVASGLIFTYVMTTVHDFASTDHAYAVTTWRSVEPVAMALGGAGGELLGRLWVLLVSAVVVRGDRLPRRLGWLGLVIGVIGIASILPPLNDATVAFGLLQIVWFAWLAGVLLTPKATARTAHSSTVDDRDVHLTETAR